MPADPGHDTIHHGADDFGSIIQRLIHTELNIARSKEDRMAAQTRDTSLARNPRPRAPLGEHDGDLLAFQSLLEHCASVAICATSRFGKRLRGRSDLRFEVRGGVDKGLDLRGAQVREREQMRWFPKLLALGR